MIEVSNLENIVPSEVMALLSDEAVQVILMDIADAARAEWIRLAGEAFFTTRRDYIAGIQPVMIEGHRATIALLGVLPNLLESGQDEVDMHDTLLGPNVPVVPVGQRGKHESKDGGYYRAIPFRHATPGAGGAVGNPMDRPGGRPYGAPAAIADAKKLGRQIYKAAKKLAGTKSDPYGKTSYGGRLPAGMAPKLRPYHATDIYAGMVRAEKTYAKATQSQYVTFRTIAVGPAGEPKGSSPWIRPATPGKFLAKQVNSFVATLAPQAFSAYVGAIEG